MFAQDTLKKYLSYEPDTGLFYWISNTNSRGPSKIGQLAGALNGGYIRISILGYKLYAHQLAFLYMTGEIPERIDHRDGNCSNNIWSNIREATRSQNQANNYLLERGVELHGAKYRARICINHQRIELGSFYSESEAQTAYNVAADKYFGEYARINR